MSHRMDYLKFATDNARREFQTGEPSSPNRRYCGPCDQWFPANRLECPNCGAKTDRATPRRPTVEPEITRHPCTNRSVWDDD